MRAVTRAVLASHPIAAFSVATALWIGWFLVGHPIGAAILLTTSLAGVQLAWSILLAAVIEAKVILLAARNTTVLGRTPWLWAQCCRFRRRRPSACAEVGVGDRRKIPVVLSTNHYYNPEGLRPVLTAPRLSASDSGAARIDDNVLDLHVAQSSGSSRMTLLVTSQPTVGSSTGPLVGTPPPLPGGWPCHERFQRPPLDDLADADDPVERPPPERRPWQIHRTKQRLLSAVWRVESYEDRSHRFG